MDFLNHTKGGMDFYPVFLLSSLQCIVETVRGCESLKKQKSQGKVEDLTVNSKEENSQDFCLGFVQEFSLCTVVYTVSRGLQFIPFSLRVTIDLEGPLSQCSTVLTLTGGVHIGARALLDINLILISDQLYHSPIPVWERRMFYLFKLFLPAFTGLGGGGSSPCAFSTQHTSH